MGSAARTDTNREATIARRPWATRSTERLAAAALIAGAASLAGCGYSFSPRSNTHIRTIAVPIFQNATLEKGIEQRLADGLTDAFLNDKTLRVVEERNADSVILGTIERYDRTPYSYDKDQNVQEYRVELTLRVSYEDRTKNKVIWEESAMRPWGTYKAEEDEIQGQDRAIAKAAEDILIKTVRGW